MTAYATVAWEHVRRMRNPLRLSRSMTVGGVIVACAVIVVRTPGRGELLIGRNRYMPDTRALGWYRALRSLMSQAKEKLHRIEALTHRESGSDSRLMYSLGMECEAMLSALDPNGEDYFMFAWHRKKP